MLKSNNKFAHAAVKQHMDMRLVRENMSEILKKAINNAPMTNPNCTPLVSQTSSVSFKFAMFDNSGSITVAENQVLNAPIRDKLTKNNAKSCPLL